MPKMSRARRLLYDARWQKVRQWKTMNIKISKPIFFVVQRFASVNVTEFGLPRIYGDNIYLIEFRARDLEHPLSEPIGMYHYAGIRRYIWRDAVWNEAHINHSDIRKKTLKLLHEECDKHYSRYCSERIKDLETLIELSRLYGAGWVVPTDSDEDRLYCRAMYKINE